MNTVTDVVGKNLCSGCGVCAGICPTVAIQMKINEYGEYVPLVDLEKCIYCGLCLKTCPFSSNSKNEDELGANLFLNVDNIQKNDLTGYYLNSYVGFSNEENVRLNSASGGITTHFLMTLLEEKAVDCVACVVSKESGEAFHYSYELVFDPEELERSSKAVYQPVESSQAVRKILDLPLNRVAFVGLPCTLRAFRNAIEAMSNEFKNKEILFLGLVCGGMRSRFFSEYLVGKCGGNPNAITSCVYRTKKPGFSAIDYGYWLCWREGQRERCQEIRYKTDGIKKYWGEKFFMLNACWYCDDVFADVADMALMDAWLREYIPDWKGTNFVMTRSKFCNDWLLQMAEKGQIIVDRIPVNKLIASQAGGIDLKRNSIKHRLYVAQKKRFGIPKKRVNPERAPLNAARIKMEWGQRNSKLTRECWKKEKSVEKLDKKVRFRKFILQRKLNFVKNIETIDRNMHRVLSAVRQKFL